jgi:hypothetical protein
MDQQRLAQLLREGADDYSQLLNGYPNATKFMDSLGQNIMQHVPQTHEIKDPHVMYEYAKKMVENQINPPADKIMRGMGGDLEHYREAMQGQLK